MRHVEIQTADGHSIEGSLFLPPDEQKASRGLLFLHGWGGGRERQYEAANLLSQKGFICLGVDLRGHGKTQRLARAVRPSDNLADAIAAYDFLASQTVIDPHCIGVAGFSYGGFLAVLVSQQRRPRWLALRAPALYRDHDIQTPKSCIDRQKLALFRRKKLSPIDSTALAAAASFRGDVLVLESERDSTVPHAQVQNYVDAFQNVASLKHVVIPEADHALSQEHWKEIALTTLARWFAVGSAT